MGVHLKREGFDDFAIFDLGDSVGGTWRANTYPGLACDVPSHLYSFSFAPGHNWSRRYAPQPEILAYLQEVTRRFGLEPHLRLRTEVTSASFDDETGRWTLTTDAGESHDFDILVTACGQLSRPDIPSIPGLDDFAGRAFHSGDWDHEHDLSGHRVAVIGTGASAIQFAPAIAPVVEHATIYQRSAPWILPKMDREYPEWEQQLFRRFPPRVAASRLGMFLIFEGFTYGFTGKDWMMRGVQRLADRERRRVLGDDPELLTKATPDSVMGCKRVLVSNEWYPMLRRPNVELLNGPIERITSGGVVGPDGVEREADTIIFGTGFRTRNFITPMAVHGIGGRELNEVWNGTPEALLGTTVPGFPNMFMLYGPNTNHGAGSVPFLIECQANYVVDAMRRMGDRDLRYIEARPEALAEWSREIAERSRHTVWVTGCSNWYVNDEGVNTNNWPGPWLEYRRRTRRLNPGHFRAVPA
jgi:cation diffusion facilitator CzcD-associated flavoprotein CzcO